MRKVIFLFATLVAIVGLAGCGDNSTKLPQTPVAHDWYVVYVPYEGGTLRCLEHAVNSGGRSAWGGPTCDFVAFYKAQRNGQ